MTDLQIPRSMTEAKLWTKIKPWLSAYGTPLRVDNVANSSVPDIIYHVPGKGNLLIELKILHGNKVTFQPTQIPIFSSINPWIWGWDQRLSGIRIARFNQFTIGNYTWPLTNVSRYGNDGMIHSKEDLGTWLTQI